MFVREKEGAALIIEPAPLKRVQALCRSLISRVSSESGSHRFSKRIYKRMDLVMCEVLWGERGDKLTLLSYLCECVCE